MNKATVLKSNRFLGIQLVDSGLITLAQLETANTRLVELMAGDDLRAACLLKILVFEQQTLEERALLSYQIEHRAVAGVSLPHYSIEYGALAGMDVDDMWATRTLPFDWVSDIWFVASAYYLSPFVRRFWEEKLQSEIVWYVSPMQELETALESMGSLESTNGQAKAGKSRAGTYDFYTVMALARVQRSLVNKLLEMGRLKPEQASEIIDSPDEMSGDAIEKLLTSDYGVSEFQILVAKSRAFDLTPFNARNFRADERTFEKLDRDFCREHAVLPVAVVGDHLVVAIADPFNLNVSSRIQERTRMKVCVLLAIESDILENLKEKQERPRSEGFGDVVEALGAEYGEEVRSLDEDHLEEESAPIVRLANRIIEDAYFSGGSDIHIEPYETHARVRVRIDGVCQEKLTIPPKVSSALVARLKVMANLDIAEKRLPQDGRIVFKQFNKKGLDLDLRVATAPLNHGEGVVMRILDKQKSTLPLPALGFSVDNLTRYRELIARPYGMILHCGPTGSGKSMTLYSALNEINTPDTVIRTAEDPIEYTLPGLCQMQMHRKIGLTFASALRAFLRQDPDIILVGEIRDSETAQIAVEAALTGHLLFSTLHTNDAPSTIARLTEMEIEPFMISASLLCVCAQRLMRRVCKVCKQNYEPDGREAEILQRALKWVGPINRASDRGCPACNGNGYKGRVGIHELMTTSDELIRGINQQMEAAKLKRMAVRNGMKTLHQDSMLKVREGITTIMESIATVPPDIEDLDAIINAENLEHALAV